MPIHRDRNPFRQKPNALRSPRCHAADLERAGIPKEDIILGFRLPELKPYMGYAVA
ncbi:element excision factor XisI family protein [Altericista sp. CCNU0014]|uniref:element excision factor XisI family protein n=1 Tax=Altericista sp. CCNU0014 TaxID=3082949 RepID=UPI00384EF1FC